MKREEAKKIIERGLSELNQALQEGKSATLNNYLSAMARFHRYSLNNCILIATQYPDATRVAGFQTWKGTEKGTGVFFETTPVPLSSPAGWLGNRHRTHSMPLNGERRVFFSACR